MIQCYFAIVEGFVLIRYEFSIIGIRKYLIVKFFFFVRNIIEIRRVFEKPIYQLTDVKRV